FSKRITADYQRQALAETSGIASMRAEASAEIMAMQLERWLMGDMDIVEQILEGMNQQPPVTEEVYIPQVPAPTEKTLFFFGDKGKREAVRYVISIIKDGMIGLFDNTDLSWATSDPGFTAEIQASIRNYIDRGNTFTQILPSLSDISCYTDSLRFLLPIYIRGTANVYYYPRMTASPQSLTLIVAPGQFVSFSYSIRSGNDNMITIVSTDKDFINAHAEQFREYLSMCKSALTVHRDPREFTPTIADFLTLRGDIIQKTAPLSTSSMPAELAQMYSEQSKNAIWNESFRKVAEEIPNFEQRLATNTHIDICPISSVEDIKAGKVPVACPYMPCEGHPCYTPETYALHLKNILRLMDTYEKYSFIPITPESYPGYNLLVNEGGMALLAHGQTATPLILEFHRPEMVIACKEHLMRIVDREGGVENSRSRVKKQLNALIRELNKEAKPKS
ncbi:MAG: hypothetical protein ACI4JY_09180, partial [Oscillospiraceae bacterium]